MTLGNEDQVSRLEVNYLNPSIWIGGVPNTVTNWKVGYGHVLGFPAQTASNSVTLWSRPGIQGVGGQTNAAKIAEGYLAGQLYFWRKTPWPSFSNGDLDSTYSLLGGKMTDTGWEFYGPTTVTNMSIKTISSTDGSDGLVNFQNNVSVGGGGARYQIRDASGIVPAIGPYQMFITTSTDGRNGFGVGTYDSGTKYANYVMNGPGVRFGILDGGTAGYPLRAMFDTTYNTNYITGLTTFSNGASMIYDTTHNLTADNQVVGATTNATVVISSDNATAANRTFALTTGIPGKVLRLVWSGTNAGELIDDSANSGGGSVRLASNWMPTQYDVLTLIGIGTDWYEVSRSAN